MSAPSGRSLPPTPDLDQQKKQARELLRAARARDAAAVNRFREHHPKLRGRPEPEIATMPLALHDAQLVLAREYGFPSWARLKQEIEARRRLRHTRMFVTDLDWYDDRARGLMSAREAGVAEALEQIREWHPAFAESTDREIRQAAFDLDAARLVYAREHGYRTWEELAARAQALATGQRIEPFRETFEAMRGRQWSRVRSLLRDHPALPRARGTNGNTLLNLAVSLAGSTCEPLPPEAIDLFGLLLESGADPNQPNDRGWTPLHAAASANLPELARRLVQAGAQVDREAHGEGGTPLTVALFWGHREVADFLGTVRVVPRNLRVAAGLGRPDLLRECFEPDGRLTPAATASRGFYRPHSGFPVWQPSNDRQEVLDEALVWAAKSDRVEALSLLVARGANVNADPYRGTPLLWAAFAGRIGAARWLLDHGADIEPATFGGPSHGEGVTALHLAAQLDRVEMARLLLERGADPAVEDAIYHSSPAGWAAHFGSARVQELLSTYRPIVPPEQESP